MAKERLIRDWTTSDTMDKLSAGAEVFFTRLIMKADDFGGFYAHPKLIKSALFPLKEYSDGTIKNWVDECITVGLIIKYKAEGKEYIHIKDFGQRLRNMRNAFPKPPEDLLRQLAATCGKTPPELEEEEEVEKEDEKEVVALVEKKFTKEAYDTVEAICDFFNVSKDVLSNKYNSVHAFVETLLHRNELTLLRLRLTKYMAYKARSQEAKHNVKNWMGTKQEKYYDGEWYSTDWELKEKNYIQPNGTSIKGTSGQISPTKDYTSEGGF